MTPEAKTLAKKTAGDLLGHVVVPVVVYAVGMEVLAVVLMAVLLAIQVFLLNAATSGLEWTTDRLSKSSDSMSRHFSLLSRRDLGVGDVFGLIEESIRAGDLKAAARLARMGRKAMHETAAVGMDSQDPKEFMAELDKQGGE